jgi:hypothetical protein
MIDDRIDVHRAIAGTVPFLVLFGRRKGAAPEWVDHALTWSDVERVVNV